MENITKKSLLEDLETIRSLADKYNNAIWEQQTPNETHYDRQPKMVRIAMSDARCGLVVAAQAIEKLIDFGIKE